MVWMMWFGSWFHEWLIKFSYFLCCSAKCWNSAHLWGKISAQTHHSTHQWACKTCKSIVQTHREDDWWSGWCGLAHSVNDGSSNFLCCSAKCWILAHLWGKISAQRHHSTHQWAFKAWANPLFQLIERMIDGLDDVVWLLVPWMADQIFFAVLQNAGFWPTSEAKSVP